MSKYSIKDLEQLSGIKAHTLRIWEQRYNFINPKRTETNIRYYDDNDLKLILNVSTLNKRGIKISKIAAMSEQAITAEVLKVNEVSTGYDDQVQSLVLCMIDFDEVRFEKIINSIILKHGFEKAMIYIIYPFLNQVGILWQTSKVCPAHEHFISCLIRQKLIVAIDSHYTKENCAKKFLLFLPEGEWHELSLLFASFLVKARGFKLIYLGQSLPLPALKEAFEAFNPDYLLTIITSCPDSDSIGEYIRILLQEFAVPILLSGIQADPSLQNISPRLTLLSSSIEFVYFLDKNV